MLPTDDQINLKFLIGRLAGFQQRHCIKLRRVHAQCLSTNTAAITEILTEIQTKISQYSKRYVWNADKFALFHHQPPRWTFLHISIKRHKLDKTRVTILAC